MELGGYFTDKGERKDWIRGIDPKTFKVLWHYDEPGLTNPAAQIEFAEASDVFILSDLGTDHPYYFEKKIIKYPPETGVKVFSCERGFMWGYMKGEDEGVRGRITPDGKNILISTKKGKVLNFDINGKLIWEKEVNPYHGPLLPLYISNDGLYFSTLYRAPEMHSLEDKRMGVPRELQLIVVNLGETILKRRFYANLGDNSMDTNVIEILGIIKKDIVGVWVMDGSGFFIKQIYMVIQWFSLQKMMYMLSESIP